MKSLARWGKLSSQQRIADAVARRFKSCQPDRVIPNERRFRSIPRPSLIVVREAHTATDTATRIASVPEPRWGRPNTILVRSCSSTGLAEVVNTPLYARRQPSTLRGEYEAELRDWPRSGLRGERPVAGRLTWTPSVATASNPRRPSASLTTCGYIPATNRSNGWPCRSGRSEGEPPRRTAFGVVIIQECLCRRLVGLAIKVDWPSREGASRAPSLASFHPRLGLGSGT